VKSPQQGSSELHTLQSSMLGLFLLGTQFNHRWAHPAVSEFGVLCLIFR
jgi:hypothetical protein